MPHGSPHGIHASISRALARENTRARTRTHWHSPDPALPFLLDEGLDPWRCHSEVFNPSFQMVFNVSFVGLCLIFIFELYACGVATGFIFYFLIC